MATPTVASLSARANVLSRHKGREHPDTVEARRLHAAADLERHIARVIEAAPPLTDAQVDRLTALLRGGAR